MNKYAHDAQDKFVLTLFNNKPGFYIDIGCGDGVDMSNSLLLEENGWNGILIDANPNLISECSKIRKCKNLFLIDATNSNLLLESLDKVNCPLIIDYLSLDIDNASLLCLEAFPFDKYKFKFLTFEHDIYNNQQINHDRKNITQEILKEKGYTKLIDNILTNPGPYEDWYIRNEYVEIINLFKGVSGLRGIECVEILKNSGLSI